MFSIFSFRKKIKILTCTFIKDQLFDLSIYYSYIEVQKIYQKYYEFKYMILLIIIEKKKIIILGI